jgi:putative heme-binding domain-containing protein
MLRGSLMLLTVSLTPFLAHSQTADPGQQVFSNICASCHGLDGQGGEHAPNIATNPEVQRMTDRELTGIVRYGIQSKGMPGFQSSLQRDQITAVVKYLRAMGSREASGSIPGNASQGKSLFFGAAQCGECHSMQGEGGFLGADLSGYGKFHSPDSIRSAILEPNKNGDQRHGTVVAVTRDGKTYTGIARNEDNFSLQMQTPDGAFHLFDKHALSHLEHKPESLMPADYRRKLTPTQLDDIVKYLSLSVGSQPKEPEEEE